MQSSSVQARLFSFCATFSKMVITPSSEVEMMRRLLGWNLDFKELPVMYHLAHVSFRDGTYLGVKLMLLSRNLESCVRKPSHLGQWSWCLSCNPSCLPGNLVEKPLV
jgi:hypothetical protein